MKSPILCWAIVLTLAVGVLSAVCAHNATWDLHPANNDWNTAANWTPATVPNGPTDTATFQVSYTPAVFLSANTEVSGIGFRIHRTTSYFTVTVPASSTLTISGVGISNGSGITQNFVTAVDGLGNRGVIQFTQHATAGTLTEFTKNGGTDGGLGGLTSFTGNASAGAGFFVNNGSVSVSALGGHTEFFDDSTAGIGTFINDGAAFSFANGGRTRFFDTATAGDGTFVVNGGTAQFASGGLVEFFGSSTGLLYD